MSKISHTKLKEQFKEAVLWKGSWVADDVYQKSSMVTNGGFLVISNKETTDSASPTLSGTPEEDKESTIAFTTQSNNSVVSSGSKYSITTSGWIKSLELWVPTISGDLSYFGYISNTSEANNPKTTVLNLDTLTAGAWNTINVPGEILSSGDEVSVNIEVVNSTASTSITGPWVRAANGVSISGAKDWKINNAGSILQLSDTDNDGANREAELNTINLGDTITFTSQSNTNLSVSYHILARDEHFGYLIAVDYSVLEIDVGPEGRPQTGDVCDMVTTIPTVAAIAEYSENVGYWPANYPSWGTVTGLLNFDGTAQAVDNNAYGVRVEFQKAYVSPDWEILSAITT